MFKEEPRRVMPREHGAGMARPARRDDKTAMEAYLDIEQGPSGPTLHLKGDWQDDAALPSSAAMKGELQRAGAGASITVSGRDVASWTGVLPAFLSGLRAECQAAGIGLELREMPQGVLRLLDVSRRGPEEPAPDRKTSGVRARVGLWAVAQGRAMIDILWMVGEVVLATLASLGPTGKARAVDFLGALREVGAAALAIVAVVNFLVGGILGFVGLVQLEQFGAQVYLANLVGIAVAREMAAIMTAIVMAGRTGAAFAANLATMQGNEEIDALETLGVSPVEHLVVPRVNALILMMPLLYLYGCAMGIAGGMVIAVTSSDLTMLGYLDETLTGVEPRHFAIGAMKSVFFGALIGIASCHIGLRAGRSAAEVGHAATSSVVVCIVGIIILDAMFAVCTNMLGV